MDTANPLDPQVKAGQGVKQCPLISKKILGFSIAVLVICIIILLIIKVFSPGDKALLIGTQEKQTNQQIQMVVDVSPSDEKTADIPRDLHNPVGVITRVYEQGDTWYLEIDQFKLYFTNSDLEEAVKDGICPSIEKCAWPNNFAIGDRDQILTTYKISPGVTIDLSGLEPYRNMWSEKLQEFIPLFPINPTLDEFSRLVNSEDPAGLHAGGAFGIVLSEGVVTDIYGIYLP